MVSTKVRAIVTKLMAAKTKPPLNLANFKRTKTSYKTKAKSLGISPTLLRQWVCRSKKGLVLHGKGGRPPVLSSEDKLLLVDLVESGSFSHTGATVDKKIQELAKARWVFNLKDPEDFREVSERTISVIKKELGITNGIGESTTTARAKACADLRHFVSFIAMNKLMTSLVKPELTINADSTQFAVGDIGDGKVKVNFIDRPETLKVDPNETNKKAGTVLFIKYHACITATGVKCPPIIVLADDKMAEGTIDVYEVKGLDTHGGLDNKGYLVFCKTRACNAEFYRWFNRTVLKKLVCDVRKEYGLDESEHAWFQLDGEQTQISCYEEEAILEDLAENLIIVGKPPASTTEVTQPCDVGTIFKASKSHLHRLLMEEDTELTQLERNLYNNLHEAMIAHYRKNSTSALNYTAMKKAKDGILKIRKSLFKMLDSDRISESFLKAGISPFNIERIFHNLKAEITPEEKMHVLSKLPELQKIMAEEGEISDAAMSRLKIKKSYENEADTSWDNKPLNHRRSVILTHKKVVKKEFEKKKAKAEELEAIAKAKEDKKKDALMAKIIKEKKKSGPIIMVFTRNPAGSTMDLK